MNLLPETTAQLATDTQLNFRDHITYDELLDILATRIETMIDHDFQQFVLLLYKIDVAEEKIRQVLADDNTADVYKKIAALLIERQQQKIISRKNTTPPPGDDDEEKW
jgi:hypothetical protein